jgi:hypothetical protein
MQDFLGCVPVIGCEILLGATLMVKVPLNYLEAKQKASGGDAFAWKASAYN